eukprot:CAMPEP_0202902778 /NCGR_PEP_ID=MMETSP1392-20130828/17045_1 /ASSEMBLY_ACC=CAM_ASM_000868 /TAXON_ID=225041 /ORGANISM="Chlamydomonas chlamydogama, Strain SAG 11-48b" /LENGTH=525 /DNA_ID=CAMNT_0049589585 /DNA_START=84 /DNA_END=1661 /DNA_ORIENTATION=+
MLAFYVLLASSLLQQLRAGEINLDAALKEVSVCEEVDELPAYSKEDHWASLYEVIGPYNSLCRVPTPSDYTTRPAWPGCLWELPKGNIPKATLWESEGIKSSQNWLQVNGDKLKLPRNGGSMAASKFLGMLPPSINMSSIRTVLDEGAGVCGLGAEIMITYKQRPLVLSYAPHDSHASQVQVCMERGVPAIIFSMARYQFPVPAGSFDMVTCKWCWHWIAASSIGAWFLEVDRVLKPGGYFVLYAAVWHNHNFRDQVEYWSNTMGWAHLKTSGTKDLAVYQKPTVQQAATTAITYPACSKAESTQPSFRRFHVPCRISADLSLQAPQRGGGDIPQEELAYVQKLVAVLPEAAAGTMTNVLDLNAGAATFALAMRQLVPSAWTLNIQPVTSVEFHHKEDAGHHLNYGGVSNYVTTEGADLLPHVFAKGLIGMYHDWCYMFPSYPRAFDLIHIRSYMHERSSCLVQFMLEVDRLLRPGGYVVFSGPGLAAKMSGEVVEPLGWEVPEAAVPLEQANVATVFRKRMMSK